ncbi:MAG TPA: hypothetical protein VIR00_10135, partial [Micromonosporaceae bacterium]
MGSEETSAAPAAASNRVASADIARLVARLPELTLRDGGRIGRRIEGVQRGRRGAKPGTIESIAAAIETA